MEPEMGKACSNDSTVPKTTKWTADSAIGWFIVVAIVLAQLWQLLKSIKDLFAHGEVTAFATVKCANDFAGVVVAVMVFVIWDVLVDNQHKRTRQALRYKFFGMTPNGIMQGGFLPIPAALSVGVLLFVTNTFVNEAYVRGDWILPAAGPFMVWVPGLRCRWSSVEDNTWLTKWGARLDREPAGVSRFRSDEKKMLRGDVPEAVEGFLHHTSNMFRGIREHTKEGQCFVGLNSNGIDPVDFPKDDIIWPNGTFKGFTNIVHPKDQPGRHCFYQCVGWKPLSLRAIIENVGGITAGSAIVVTVTGKISAYVGPKLITGSTEPHELLKVFARTNPGREPVNCMKNSVLSHSKAWVAFLLGLTYYLLKTIIVAKFDADGMYTVDYYVTFVMFLSAFFVIVIRVFHPYRCMTQSFTAKMWQNGQDRFVVTGSTKAMLTSSVPKNDKGEVPEEWGSFTTVSEKISASEDESKDEDVLYVVTFDLMQWMHLARYQRSILLVDYARRPHRDTAVEGHYAAIARVNAVETSNESGSWHPTGNVVVVVPTEGLKLYGWRDAHIAILLRGDGTYVQIKNTFLVEVGCAWDKMLKDARALYNIDYKPPQEKMANYSEQYVPPDQV